MRHRAVFLDRDGVINKAVIYEGKSYPPKDAASLELMPDAKTAVEHMRDAGYLCICVTNQPDISRGTRSPDNVAAMNQKVIAALGLDDLFMCPHDNKDDCACRKPKPGMIFDAAAKWDIDLTASIMVGDRTSDIKAGLAAGCKTVFITTPEIADQEIPPCTMVCKTLTEVVCFVQSLSKNNYGG